MNIVILQGTLTRVPEERQLRDRVMAAYEVMTRDESGMAITAPVVLFDPPAAAFGLDAGDAVTVVGEVRRRFFRFNGRTESRTEVVATTVAASSKKAARTAIARAVELVQSHA